MNLAFHYPTIYWNTACLISDSGGAERDDSELEEEEKEDLWFVEGESAVEEFVEEDDEEDEEDEEAIAEKKKKKARSTNYGKIASAIGKMKSEGVEIVSPKINKSSFTFSPDAETNTIRFGLSGITRIGEELIQAIIENRPYESVDDFLKKVKINKPQMVNLIKSGAFDDFGDNRKKIMENYIRSISDQKKRVTLQNMKMLIDFNLIPNSLEFEKKVFNFNKYIKKFKHDKYYLLNEIAMNFYEVNFDMDKLVTSDIENIDFMILQTTWDKIYQNYMDKVRPWVKENHDSLLESINNKLIQDLWNKYCGGSISKWEMDSVSYYSHEHELQQVDNLFYEFANFSELSENPEIDRIIPIKGKQIPIFKLERIAGTVLDKDKNKKTVTLLTTDGVVVVKVFGPIYSKYDKQISEKNPTTGKKIVIEKSWFTRGNKIIVTGIKRDDSFMAKKYKNTPYHLIEKITDIKEDGRITTIGERIGEEEE